MKKFLNNEINELLNAPEGEYFEFKAAKNSFEFDKTVHYLCALSNCGGGKLVLGVSNERPCEVVAARLSTNPNAPSRA